MASVDGAIIATVSVSCKSSTSLIGSNVGVLASSFSAMIDWDSAVFSPTPPGLSTVGETSG